MENNSLKRTLAFAFLTVAVALTGCAPSIDPAAKADLDARIASLRGRATTVAAPPEGAPAPMPLAAGQWAQYKMKLSNGQPKLLTEKILKQQGSAFWYEVVHETYQGRTIEQFLIDFGSDRQHPRVKLLAMREKNPRGRVIQVSARALSLPLVTYNTYRAKAAQLVAPWPPLPREPAVVPAGRFEDCSHGHSESNFGPGHRWITDSWLHPAVPLSGVVAVINNHGFVNELVGYGTSGAHSDF